MKQRQSQLILYASVAGLLLFGYTNCSKEELSTLSSTSSVSNTSGAPQTLFASGTCDQDLKLLFDNGYHNFLKTNCALCHTNGPGKGRFSSNNLDDAFNDFMQTGYSKVSDNATSNSHNPPYTGVQHVTVINDLRLTWQKGLSDYAKCKGISVEDTNPTVSLSDILTLETTQKKIPDLAVGANAVLTWSLDTDLKALKSETSLPNLQGAKFDIRVGKYQTSSGETYYTFTLPHIFQNGTDVKIKTMQAKVNGRLLTFPTTFRYIDTGIYKNSKNDNTGLLTTGSLVSPGAFSANDTVSFAFEKIEATTLPAAPSPVTVNFANSNYNIIDSSTGFVDLTLNLNRSPDSLVTVTISADGADVCGSKTPVDVGTCNAALKTFICSTESCPTASQVLRARSIVGVNFNRFDWDYKFTSTSVSFLPGETSKTIRVLFSKDIRKETNRLLSLRIDDNLSGANKGSKSSLEFLIKKITNPTPPVGVATFTELMSSSGVLGTYCLKCHNSRDLNGGYDMSNYDLMRQKGIIVPFDIESLMYARMNPASSKFSSAAPMPLEGQLPVELRKEIENWIKAGALNN